MEKRRILPALLTTALLSLGLVVVSTPTKTEVVKAAEGTWTLVDDASTLVEGDQVVIAAKNANVALSTNQKSKNRGQTNITKTGATIAISADTQVLTLETGKVANTFAFNTGKGYLYAASSSNNYLKTETTMSNNSSWKIEISSTGAATVKAQGSNTRNWLRHNSSSSLFACYSSGQNDICLYKLVTEVSDEPVTLKTPTIEVAYDGTASWNAVVNAVEYKYIINDGEAQTTTETSVKLNDGDTIKVQAIGNGDKILDGEWTEVSTYTRDDYYLTIAEALEKGKTAGDAYSASKYVVTGKIKSIANTTFGNMTIEDETGSLYIYGVYSADGSVRYDAMKKGVKPVVGDTVTLYGPLGTYKSSPQMKDSWMVGMESTHPHAATSYKKNEEGHWKECTHCGAKFEEASHTYTETVTAPTCTVAGYTTHACTCGYSYKDTEVTALGHTWGEATYSWNEDYTECTATRTCATDETHKETETVEAQVVTTGVTCTDAGTKTSTATFANEAFAVQTHNQSVEAKGHAWGEVTYSWNADHTECTATRTCATDATHVETEKVTATVTTVDSTCGEAGSKTYTATFTNEAFAAQSHKEDLELALHTWGEATYTWNADHTECTATRTCTENENHKETETAEASVVTVESTCGAAGSKTYTVEFENEAFAAQTHKENLEVLAHTWGEVTYTWNADHTECTATRACTEDATHVETEKVTATVNTVESTCEAAGSKTYTVTFANEAFAAQTHKEDLALKEHSYDEGVITTEPTQEAEGVKTFTCGGCGHTYTEVVEKLPATPEQPAKKGCRGTTTGLIGLLTLAGALLISKKRK